MKVPRSPPTLHVSGKSGPWFAVRSLLPALLLMTATPATAQTTAWTDFETMDETAFLLRDIPAEILVFDLNTSSWSDSIPLPQTPTAFGVDSSHIYVAYGVEVWRMERDGGNPGHVVDAPGPVHQLLMDDNLLFANRTDNEKARITVIDKNTNTIVDDWSVFTRTLWGASIAPTINRIFGHDPINITPRQINFADYNDIGMISDVVHSPYHSEYPHSGQTWVFPDDSKVIDISGTIYHTSDLTYANSLASELSDICFDDSGHPFILAEDLLLAYSNSLLETGRLGLAEAAQNIACFNGQIVAFYEDISAASGVSVQVVDQADFVPLEPGPPVSTEGLAYEVDSIALDSHGVVYLLNTALASIFRWDISTQEYLETISLPEAGEVLAYSEALDSLYVYTSTRRIYRVGQPSTAAVIAAYVNVPNEIDRLISLETDLLAFLDSSYGPRFFYANNGNLLTSSVQCVGPSNPNFYDTVTERLYCARGWIEYLGNNDFGDFGVLANHPFSNGLLAISDDRSQVIDTFSQLFDADSLVFLDQLDNDVLTAVWNGLNQLFTVRRSAPTASDPALLQRWNADFSIAQQVSVGGAYTALLAFGNEVLLITSSEGIPSFTLMNSGLTVVAPQQLAAPDLDVSGYSAIAVQLSWKDVQGEQEYVLERKLSTDEAWQTFAIIPVGRTRFVDTHVFTDYVYQYRLRARNGALESAQSSMVEVDLRGMPGPPLDPATIRFVPDDVFISAGDNVYLYSIEHESIFVWDSARQDWKTTIALLDAPKYLDYSPHYNAMFTLYPDSIVYSINLDSKTQFELPLVELPPVNVCGLHATDRYIFTCDARDIFKSTNSYRAHGPAGNLVNIEERPSPLNSGVWSQGARKIFYTLDNFNPLRVAFVEVSADGAIGPERVSPLFETGIEHPIKVHPDGSIILFGSGSIYDPDSLTKIDELPSPINDAIWIDDELITLTGSTINKNPAPDFIAEPQLTLPEDVIRILPTKLGHIIVVVKTADENTALYRYDSHFNLVPPPIFLDDFE